MNLTETSLLFSVLQVCVLQACTPISSLDYIQACPVGNNGLTCADNGVIQLQKYLHSFLQFFWICYMFLVDKSYFKSYVYHNYINTNTLQVCDNLNQCSCNVGFTGTSCEEMTGSGEEITGSGEEITGSGEEMTGSGTVNSGMYCVTHKW